MNQSDAINLLAGATHAARAGDKETAQDILRYVEAHARWSEIATNALYVQGVIRDDEPGRIKATPRIG
jgi:hypothetical protein